MNCVIFIKKNDICFYFIYIFVEKIMFEIIVTSSLVIFVVVNVVGIIHVLKKDKAWEDKINKLIQELRN